MRRKIVILLKGYPRLSETFIAQELLGLERAGLDLVLVSMRRPTDKKRHPVHDEIRAPVVYLPEYLHEEPLARGQGRSAGPAPRPASGARSRDLSRSAPRLTRNRVRRFGQALVLAAEWPKDAGWLHAHFIHTPASVATYASRITGIDWTCSAHAKDIWTSADWELEEKLRHGPLGRDLHAFRLRTSARSGRGAGPRASQLSRSRPRPVWPFRANARTPTGPIPASRSSSSASAGRSKRKDTIRCWRRSLCCRPASHGGSSISAAAKSFPSSRSWRRGWALRTA